MADIPKEINGQMNAYAALYKDRTEAYVKKALELAKQGPGPEYAGPVSGPSWLPYPWWNLLLIGPIQIVGAPPGGPFMPSKVMNPAEPAWMISGLWRNPAPINWVAGTPSACQVMNGRQFQINFEVVNLTSVIQGPDLAPIAGTFPNAPNCTQWNAIPIVNLPVPAQGKPDLYNLYGTVDIVGTADQPFAGAASWILDPDTEPQFLLLPGRGPHWHYDVPAQFICYTR